MKFNRVIQYFILCIGLLFSLSIFAVVETSQGLARSAINITSPADAASFGTLLSSSGTTAYYATCASNTTTYDLGRIDYETPLTYTGRLYNENYLYESTVNGIAIIPIYRTQAINTGDMLNGTVFSIPPKPQTVWIGNLPNSERIKNNLTWSFKTFVYKDATRIEAGTYNVPQQTVFRLKCYDTAGVLQEIRSFNAGGFQVIAEVTSCTPTETSAIIQMDDIPLTTIENTEIGKPIATKSRSFSLTCQPNIDVYVSFNDLVNPSNTGKATTLTADSTATGVGYMITTSSNTGGFSLSPQGSVAGIPGATFYYYSRSGTDKSNVMPALNLGFSYVKKDNTPKEGTAKSIVGITYSYR